jgi:hypothetical protein
LCECRRNVVEASRKMGIWPELVDDDAMRFEFPSASSKPVRGSIFKSLEWLFIACETIFLYIRTVRGTELHGMAGYKDIRPGVI